MIRRIGKMWHGFYMKQLDVSPDLARKLIDEQFPEFADLTIIMEVT